MKKTILMLLVAAPMSIFAQLKVNSDGTTLAGSDSYRHTDFYGAKVGLESYTSITGGSDNVAIQGAAYMHWW